MPAECAGAEPLTAVEVDLRHVKPGLQIDEEARRGLLADARHETQRIGVVGRDRSSKVDRGVHRHDRERQSRPHTVSAEQRLEAHALLADREAVEGVRVFADMVVDVEEDLGARLAHESERAGCDRHAVADTRDLDEHLAQRRPFQQHPSQRPDHARSNRARHERPCEMTQHERGSIGGVGRVGRCREVEANLHQALHLRLRRGAIADDCLFHLVRRVLHDFAANRGSLGEREAARLADRHRGAHVHLKEDVLDDHDIWLHLRDEAGQLAAELGESLRQRIGRLRGEHSDRGAHRCRRRRVDSRVAAP